MEFDEQGHDGSDTHQIDHLQVKHAPSNVDALQKSLSVIAEEQYEWGMDSMSAASSIDRRVRSSAGNYLIQSQYSSSNQKACLPLNNNHIMVIQ